MMRVVLAIVLVVLALAGVGDAQWARFMATTGSVAPSSGFGGGPYLREYNVFGVPNSVTPAQYYVPGTGNPAISTADYYHTEGLYGLRPYDLTSAACGAVGARIAAANGRYAWFSGPDHNSVNTQWADGAGIMLGFSGDPGILPSVMIPVTRFNNTTTGSPGATFNGTISGNMLTVISMTDGAISEQDTIAGAGVTPGTQIMGIGTVGTGIGQTGTYGLTASSTVGSSTPMTATMPASQLDYFPYLICNPDDTTNPFYMYNQFTIGGTYFEGLSTSPDMFNWTAFGPTHRVTSTAYGVNLARAFNFRRIGTGNWTSLGLTGTNAPFSVLAGQGIWNSTDGKYFAFTGTFANTCLPTPDPGDIFCRTSTTSFQTSTLPNEIVTPVGGQNYIIQTESTGWDGGSNTTGLYATLAPVDANFSILTSPSPIRISDVIGPEGGASFPGPRSLAGSHAYQEDGILYDYLVRGFFVCLNAAGCQSSNVKYQDGAWFQATTSGASGTTATLNVSLIHTGTLKIGQYITGGGALLGSGSQSFIITSFGSGTGGTGTYTLTCSPSCVNQATTVDLYAIGGGLSQQLIDRYCYVYDATAAAIAAPSGVKATTNAGVVTLSWDQCVPGTIYNLYYGFSPTSQTNFIGAVNGASRTLNYVPNLQTPATMYFKLVTLNGSIEEGSRVVSTYVSSSASFVNQHVNRVLAAGADPATVDRTWLDTVYQCLNGAGPNDCGPSNAGLNALSNLRTWADPSFGVVQDGTLPYGNVSTVFDLGTTRLPRGGDLTFCTGSFPSDCNAGTSTAKYEPTAFGGTTPGVVGPSADGHAFFGNTKGVSRSNNIRRMVEITVCGLYNKPGTATATLAAFGGNHFNLQMTLQHTSGTPGNASFALSDDANTLQTVTQPMSLATGTHLICGTFDTTGATSATSPGTLKVYADGVVTSSPNTTLHSNIDISLQTTLNGQWTDTTTAPFLGAGSSDNTSQVQSAGPGPLTDLLHVFTDQQGNYIFGATMIFDKAFTQAQITSLYNLYMNRITPPVAAGSPSVTITSAPYSAFCNGVADDSSAFSAWNTAAVAWDAANPSVPGSIVLTIPNSECMFLQGGSGIKIVQGILNHSVRIVGAGTSSKLSDGGTGGGFFLGGGGQFGDNVHQANTATGLKGSTSIALTSCPGAGCAADVALFTVGNPVLMTGGDTQGAMNYPTNPWFWDYLTVACASTTLTCSGGNVSFTTPLTHDYKSTWPLYYAGSPSQVYAGGPATLYALDPTWAITAEYNNLIIDQTRGQTQSNGKSNTYKNVTFLGSACGIATQDQYYALINVTMTSCIMEVDKLVDTMVAQNVTISQFAYQSATVKQSIFSELNVTTAINGSGINTIIANSTLVDWAPGSYAYGASYGKTYMLGNNIASITPRGVSFSDINFRGVWSGGTMTVPQNLTVSSAANNGSGLIRLTVNTTAGWTTNLVGDAPPGGACAGTYAVTVIDGTHLDLQGSTFTATCSGTFGNLPLLGIVPGGNIYFSGSNNTTGPVLQVADVSVGANNSTVVSFNLNGSAYAGAFPTMPLPGSGYASMHVHAVPQLFASGNYGSAAAIDINQTPPGAPLWSYSKVKFAGANGTYTAPIVGPPTVIGNGTYVVPVWGLLSQVHLGDPNDIASGSALSFDLDTAMATLNSSSARSNFLPSINATLTGTRTINPTSTAGAQSGDSLSSFGAGGWMINDQTAPCFWNGSACAIPGGGIGTTSVTVEITTNQGVVNPAQQ